MERMTLVLREAQLRWLRRQVFEAKDRGERGVDMSNIIRRLLEEAMARDGGRTRRADSEAFRLSVKGLR